jgi:hypothetical protein
VLQEGCQKRESSRVPELGRLDTAKTVSELSLSAAEALNKLHKDALELPEELQEAVQCYVLGSSSQVGVLAC